MSKQDSLASKIKELAHLTENKKCFDCGQRGPTYVNTTVGTFICTTCSGILRGLNNPHRVKSISMATFTEQEIDFICKTGNKRNQIWMSRWDPKEPLPTHNPKDDGKMKEYLRKKYDQKTWFAEEQLGHRSSITSHCNQSKDSTNTSVSENVSTQLSFSGDPFGAVVSKPSVTSNNNKNLLDFDLIGSQNPSLSMNSNSGDNFLIDLVTINSNVTQPKLNESFSTQSRLSVQAPSNSVSLFGSSASSNQPLAQNTTSVHVPILQYGVSNITGQNSDKYAALSELDDIFRSGPTPSSSVHGSQHSNPLSVNTTNFSNNPQQNIGLQNSSTFVNSGFNIKCGPVNNYNTPFQSAAPLQSSSLSQSSAPSQSATPFQTKPFNTSDPNFSNMFQNNPTTQQVNPFCNPNTVALTSHDYNGQLFFGQGNYSNSFAPTSVATNAFTGNPFSKDPNSLNMANINQTNSSFSTNQHAFNQLPGNNLQFQNNSANNTSNQNIMNFF